MVIVLDDSPGLKVIVPVLSTWSLSLVLAVPSIVVPATTIRPLGASQGQIVGHGRVGGRLRRDRSP